MRFENNLPASLGVEKREEITEVAEAIWDRLDARLENLPPDLAERCQVHVLVTTLHVTVDGVTCAISRKATPKENS